MEGQMYTAIVTPFDNKGNIDFHKTSQLVDYLIDNGTDGLVVSGTTGESPTLTDEEKQALFAHIVKVVAGRIPVIAGTGCNNTRASVEMTKKAEKAGVDGIMVVSPYYNKPNQEGIFQHYKTIAEATSLPIMMYNIPGRVVVNMSVDTIVELSKIDNIVSIKEASKDLEQISEIIRKTDDDFLVYSGDDQCALPILAIGGKGVVSVASHVVGPQIQEMMNAFKQGDTKDAANIHRNLLPVYQELFEAPNPAPVKTALQMKGFDVGGVRLPLVPLTEKQRLSLQSVLQSFAATV